MPRYPWRDYLDDPVRRNAPVGPDATSGAAKNHIGEDSSWGTEPLFTRIRPNLA